MEGGIFRSNLRNFAILAIDQMAGPLDDWAVHVDTNAPEIRRFRNGYQAADDGICFEIRSIGSSSGG